MCWVAEMSTEGNMLTSQPLPSWWSTAHVLNVWTRWEVKLMSFFRKQHSHCFPNPQSRPLAAWQANSLTAATVSSSSVATLIASVNPSVSKNETITPAYRATESQERWRKVGAPELIQSLCLGADEQRGKWWINLSHSKHFDLSYTGVTNDITAFQLMLEQSHHGCYLFHWSFFLPWVNRSSEKISLWKLKQNSHTLHMWCDGNVAFSLNWASTT